MNPHNVSAFSAFDDDTSVSSIANAIGISGLGGWPEYLDDVDGFVQGTESVENRFAKDGSRHRIGVDRDDPKATSLQAFRNGSSGFIRIARCADHRDGPGAREDLVRTTAHGNLKWAPAAIIPQIA